MGDKEGKQLSFLPKNKSGQVTIFIIIAIVIIAGIVAFFVFKGNFFVSGIPASVQPAYNTFSSCLEDKARTGISILESQGGYIELPEFEPGNSYMPFSSQLNAFGSPIPYWYYVSLNNIQKEQVPSENEMETELENFINEEIRNCYLGDYYAEGYEILFGEPKSNIDISPNKVDVNLDMDLTLTRGNDTVLVASHKVAVDSKLGNLYASAKKIYEKEQKELFLENYGIDVLRLYAPVDGVRVSCSPETWNAEEIFAELKESIEVNTFALTTQRQDSEDRYFYVDAGISESARFIASKNWANSFEVLPSEDALLIATPVGNQQGLGVIGFCYVPYHFVYNVKYPVLVQVYDGDEVFQFPLAVVIQGNKPRTALNTTAESITTNLCLYKNSLTTVSVLGSDLGSVAADISYECFGETCFIGETEGSSLSTNFPQCTNGYIVAKADGFKEAKFLHSTVQEGTSATIILDKLYNLDVKLNLDNAGYNGNALIYFNSDEDSRAIYYPQQRSVKLSQGEYEILVYLYRNSSIQFRETTSKQCIDIPGSGLGSLLGISKEKCFDVTVPSQIISNVLAGGGSQNVSISESSLQSSNTIEISTSGFSVPETIEQLQNNYLLFEQSSLEVSFN